MSSVVIDFDGINKLCMQYVTEYYTNRQKTERPDDDHVYRVVDILNALPVPVNQHAAYYEVQSLNGNELRRVDEPGPEGMGCLRGGKPLAVSSLLGKGMFGSVYKVDSKRAVKIQVVKHSYMHTLGLPRHIKLEQEISKKAGEWGVGPKVYDTYICCGKDKKCYIVMYMELLKGKPLDDFVKTAKKTDIDRAHKLISDKINLLHKNRILHSDLHDRNIYVHKTRAGLEVKLIDFGLAKYFDDDLVETKENDFRFLGKRHRPNPNDATLYVAKRMLDMGNVISSDAAV